MISFISSFEIITAAVCEAMSKECKAKLEGWQPDPNIFLWIAASVADAVAVNPNGIKTFLASGLSTFFISGYPVFNNGLKSLRKNPPDCRSVLRKWIFYNLIIFEILDNFTFKVWYWVHFILILY